MTRLGEGFRGQPAEATRRTRDKNDFAHDFFLGFAFGLIQVIPPFARSVWPLIQVGRSRHGMNYGTGIAKDNRVGMSCAVPLALTMRGYLTLFLDPVTQTDQGIDFDFLCAETLTGVTPKMD